MRRRPNHIPCLVAAAGLVLFGSAMAGCKRDPGAFATPEEAVAALASVVGTGDERRVEEIFGAGSMELFRSGDPEDDRAAAARVKEMMTAKVDFEELDADTRVALFGEEAWPFPIPLMRRDGKWRFDTAAGREELLNRRIGRNELSTLASLHEYVDAQREYASQGRDGNPPAFAQRFFSSEGKHDGLYWPAGEGEPPSPLGELLATATPEPGDEPEPFHGYYYRILTGQGANAPGGEASYLNDKGLLSRGFAAVAWPAKYGNSGVMTFLVNQRGMVYQKDLGADTATAAAAIQSFNPDASWQPTGDTMALVEEEGASEEAP